MNCRTPNSAPPSCCSLAVAVVVILLIGSVALSRGELPRLTVRVGLLLVGGVPRRGVLRLALLRVGWLLTDVVLAGAAIIAGRVLALTERRAGLLLRLFIVAGALLCVGGLLAATSVCARLGALAAGSELRLLRAGPVLPAGVLLTRVNGEGRRSGRPGAVGIGRSPMGRCHSRRCPAGNR